MLDRLGPAADDIAQAWMTAFGAALRDGSARALSELFVADSHWRNLFGLSWQFATISHVEKLAPELLRQAREVGAGDFRIDVETFAPRKALVAGREVIEAIFSFATVNGPGIGALRLLASPVAGGLAQAWTISTTLDFDKICDARARDAEANPTPAISPAPTGPSSDRHRVRSRIATPTFSSSAAAMPVLPRPLS